MLFSCQTSYLASRFGIETATDMLIQAGYTAVDLSTFGNNAYMFTENWQETAKALRVRAESRGAC